MEILNGVTFEGELVAIDDKHFVDCVLRNCILEYGGGSVILERTHISGCHHVFFGGARCTVNYLERMGLMPSALSEWAPSADHVN